MAQMMAVEAYQELRRLRDEERHARAVWKKASAARNAAEAAFPGGITP